MKTQYVFDSVEFEKFQNKYYPTEKEENVYEEEEKVVEKRIKKRILYYTNITYFLNK